MLIPNNVHYQVRTLSIVRCSAQAAEYRVVNRVLVGHLEHWRHHHMFALLGEVFRATQDALKIPRSAINGIIHHHLPAIRETCHHFGGEVNLMFINVFRLQRFSYFANRQIYGNIQYIDTQIVINN